MNAFLRKKLIYIAIKSSKKDIELKIDRIAFIDTLDYVLNFCSSLFVLIFMSNEILKVINNFNVLTERNIYILFSVFITIDSVAKINRKNSWKQYIYNRKSKYTEFFDGNGHRISELDQLIYNNRLYEIIRNEKKDLCLLEVYKHSWSEETITLLNDAIVDKNNKIEIYNYDLLINNA
jgi:hypothetical protein